MDEPQHMDKYSRNERLYSALLGMGLICDPIRNENDPSKIESISVSADEGFVTPYVAPPVTRSESIDSVVATSGSENVIDFPPAA